MEQENVQNYIDVLSNAFDNQFTHMHLDKGNLEMIQGVIGKKGDNTLHVTIKLTNEGYSASLLSIYEKDEANTINTRKLHLSSEYVKNIDVIVPLIHFCLNALNNEPFDTEKTKGFIDLDPEYSESIYNRITQLKPYCDIFENKMGARTGIIISKFYTEVSVYLANRVTLAVEPDFNEEGVLEHVVLVYFIKGARFPLGRYEARTPEDTYNVVISVKEKFESMKQE